MKKSYSAPNLHQVVPVFDIVNCGPRNRFVANGVLVSNCNWQNLPARGPSAGIRNAIKAPQGYSIVVGDSSNIELRVAMAAAGQNDVLDKLEQGVDLYCDFASKLFGRVVTKADAKERMLGKIAMLSLQYGAGWPRFKDMVRVQSKEVLPDDTAKRVVDLYRAVHSRITELHEYCGNVILPDIANGCSLIAVDRPGWAITSHGGFGQAAQPGVRYHNLRKELVVRRGVSEPTWVYTAGRETVVTYSSKVTENLCQYLAGRIVLWQTTRINQRYPVALSVHDEAVIVVPDAEVPDAVAYMNECLSLAPPWCRGQIPLACEVGVGKSYGEAK